ncbi:hypothetical protein [Actinomadura sp. 9N215]|uniref:hypothetical protein n=1 Tax=Actinomadura sp. 9N215 TaxID=3375150 RepID=UPI0037A6EFF5
MARRLLASGGAALIGTSLAIGFLTACGDESPGEASPPSASLSPASPASSAPATRAPDPGAQPGIQGARAALQQFLRGQAAGDQAVCRYVAAGGAFVRGPALKGDCPRGVRLTPHLLRPRERRAMRTVTVTGGDLRDGMAVIPFSALNWTRGAMSVETLQSEFALRHNGKIWQIVA